VPPDPPFDRAYRARFDASRPFIRSGEDYLMVHRWAARGAVPASQADFDSSLVEVGATVRSGWKTSLYAVRDRLLEFHRSLWLSWNPLYPGVAEAMKLQRQNPAVWILSTKKAEFIAEILVHHGVAWPLERTLYTGSLRKLSIIDERAGTAASELIDDQFDHLDFDHPTCRCFLALWGYVAPGAQDRARLTLTLAEAVQRISEFSFPVRPNE
jgi:hypothetical protein